MAAPYDTQTYLLDRANVHDTVIKLVSTNAPNSMGPCLAVRVANRRSPDNLRQ